MGIIYDNSAFAFIVVTLILGGGAAWLTGRAMARTWQPLWKALGFCLMLALPVRFLHFSLGGGTLLSAHYLLVDGLILIAIGYLSFRIAQTSTMVNQYPWLYERTSPISWTEKS
jgi:hypothetical protein